MSGGIVEAVGFDEGDEFGGLVGFVEDRDENNGGIGLDLCGFDGRRVCGAGEDSIEEVDGQEDEDEGAKGL